MATRNASTFEKKFKPISVPDANEGENWIEARVFELDPNRVQNLWTLVDPMTDSGMMSWLPGYHYVNREGYVYTENPWTDADLNDEYRRW